MAEETNETTNPSSQTPASQPAGEQTAAAATATESPVAEAPRGPTGPYGSGGGGRQGGGRGRPGGGRGRGGDRNRRDDRDESGVESALIRIYRCAKVVKGGRTFSFGALVVAGDRKGQVGIGYGKANEVPAAVEKATKDARRQLIRVPLKGTTIPHIIQGRSGASRVTLVPAMPGTGVTAGKSVRPILELAGITDVLTKAYGSTSPKNLLKATIDALQRLQSRETVENARGVKLEKAQERMVEATAAVGTT